MATHNLFFGGQRTNNPEWAMLPSVEPKPDEPMAPDNRGNPVLFSLNRRLIWSDCCESCGCGTEPGPDACRCTAGSKKLDGGSTALKQYLKHNAIAVGDVINAVILPRQTALMYLWWAVESPIDPFTFDVRVRGNAASLGGTIAAPVPFVVAAGIDGTVKGSGLIDVTTLNGGQPLWLDQNDMLQVVINDLPAVAAPGDCSPCSDGGGIKGSSIIISPIVLDPCRFRN